MNLTKLFGGTHDETGGSNGANARRLKNQSINKHCNICIVCGKKIRENKSIHHVSRIPPVRVILHKGCHKKIEADKSNKWKHLKPRFTRNEVRIIKQYHKFKNVSGNLFEYYAKFKRPDGSYRIFQLNRNIIFDSKKRNSDDCKWVRM